jgi:dienelactone hydrolase
MRTLAFVFVLAMSVATSLAEVKTDTIEYKDGDVTCKGVLVYPKPEIGAAVMRPGVMIIPEWWGMNDYVKNRAKQLAELGYIAFVADMYGDGKVTADVKQASEWSKLRDDRPKFRARAMAGLDAFRKAGPTAALDTSKVAAIGYCFGGTGVLELARGGADLAGVVSFHGGLAMPGPAPAVIKAKILVCHGADDPMVKPEEVHTFITELQKAKADYQVNIYANTVHSFTNPDADSFKIDGIAYNKQSDQRSWEAMKAFLAEVFVK